jgi:hypothetical protein
MSNERPEQISNSSDANDATNNVAASNDTCLAACRPIDLPVNTSAAPSWLPDLLLVNGNQLPGRDANWAEVPTTPSETLGVNGIESVRQPEQQTEQAVNVVRLLREAIIRDGLPEGWLEGSETDPDWVQRAARHIVFARNLRDAVQAQAEFGRAARYNDFPNQLPPGARLEGNRLILDLPQTLDENDPANFERWNRNNWWLEAVTPRLEQVARESRNQPFVWADIELQNMNARLNERGELVGFSDRRKPNGNSNEFATPANMLQSRFDISFNPETGRYIVTPTIQAQNASGYLNSRREDIGNPMPLQAREFEPDDFVAIQIGNTTQLTRARDLAAFQQERRFEQEGERYVTIAGDVGMLATGTIEVGIVLRAAALAARSAGVAGLFTRRMILPGLNGTSDMALGGSGFILNNASARDSQFGGWANDVRNYGFLFKAGLGLYRAGASFTPWSRPSHIEQILQQSGQQGLARTFRIASLGSEASAYPSAIPTGIAVTDILRDLSQDRFNVQNGRTLVDDMRERPRTSADSSTQHIRPLPELSTEYGNSLGRERPEEVRNQIREIMNGLNSALRPDATPEERERFRNQLAERLLFTPEEIRQLEAAQVGPLRNNELNLLRDATGRQSENFLPATRALAEQIMNGRDPDIRRAAELALLILSDATGSERPTQTNHQSTDSGASNEPLVSRGTTIEASVDYGPFRSRNGAMVATPVHIDRHELEQSISREDLRRSLYRNFENSMDPGRQLVLAHAMMSTGVMSINHFNSVMNLIRRARGGAS